MRGQQRVPARLRRPTRPRCGEDVRQMFLKAIDCFLAQHLQPSVLLLGQTYKPGVTALKMVTKWEAEKPYRNEPALCVLDPPPSAPLLHGLLHGWMGVTDAKGALE